MKKTKVCAAAALLIWTAFMLFAVPGTAHADFAYDEVRMEVDKDVPEKGTLEELPVPTFGK